MRAFQCLRTVLFGFFMLSAAVTQAATFVYVSNADSREISVLQLDAAAGDLLLVQTVPVSGQVMPMAVSPPVPLCRSEGRALFSREPGDRPRRRPA